MEWLVMPWWVYVLGAPALVVWLLYQRHRMTAEFGMVNVLKHMLEDPCEQWVQGEYNLVNEERVIAIWTASGWTFVSINRGIEPSLVARWRIWQSVHVARRNILKRKAGLIPEQPPTEVKAKVIDMREAKAIMGKKR